MLVRYVVVTRFFLVLCILGSNQALHCFDCDPHSYKEECYIPSKNRVPYINCNDLFTEQHNSTLICLSAYVIFPETDYIGFYRGCQQQPSAVIDFCDWFEEVHVNPDGFLEWCAPCNTSGCNAGNQSFEQRESNGDTLYIKLILLLVTILFRLIVV